MKIYDLALLLWVVGALHMTINDINEKQVVTEFLVLEYRQEIR